MQIVNMSEEQVSAITQSNCKIVMGPNEVCPDEKAYRDKVIIMEKQRVSAKFRSVSDTFRFLAALTLTTGMAILGVALKNVNGFSGFLKALVGSESTVGLVLVGVAAAATAISITSDYIGAKHASNAYFDQSEINAQHNARYVRKELEKKKLVLVSADTQQEPFPENKRADDKTWVQVTRPQVQTGVQLG